MLVQHPGVAQAVVIGRDDEQRGERVVAFVTLAAGAAADPRRAQGLLPRPSGPLRVSDGAPGRRRAPHRADRQDPASEAGLRWHARRAGSSSRSTASSRR
ncbi:MAG: hypothetical protein R2695_16880 [Acidimicrobiales bacterium]